MPLDLESASLPIGFTLSEWVTIKSALRNRAEYLTSHLGDSARDRDLLPAMIDKCWRLDEMISAGIASAVRTLTETES